jgi:kynureninase
VDEPSLRRLRSEFPILATTTYMISNSLGAMPRGVEDSLREYAATWATRGVRAWAERWWTMGEEVGDAIAPFIGARAGSVAMCENVTAAHMSILSTLPPPATRPRIVCSAADFPSIIYLLRAQASLGYTLTIVPTRDDGTADPEQIAAAIDDRTALVAISHVLFRTSYILDPRPVIERAHATGARVALDLYQAAGIIPVDVTALGVDFAAGGCLKWLCGGPGNAFLYVRPDLAATIRPRYTGWMAHPAPFSFDTADYEPLAGSRRMQTGTPAIPAYYAALPGLRLLASVGIARIRATSIAHTQRLLALVDEHGFTTVASRDPDRLAGTVAVFVPDALDVARTLNARDIVVDYRPGVGIRLAPHVYNAPEEVDQTLDAIAEIVRTRKYVEVTRPTLVT